MPDAALAAAKIAMIRDAVTRIDAVLPAELPALLSERTAREGVALKLLVAIQKCVTLASHVLADAGWGVPKTYGDSFSALAEHAVVTDDLSARCARQRMNPSPFSQVRFSNTSLPICSDAYMRWYAAAASPNLKI